MNRSKIVMKESLDGWRAICGCLFHYFHGPPSMNFSLSNGNTILMGMVEPHWHPCRVHAGLQAVGAFEALIDEAHDARAWRRLADRREEAADALHDLREGQSQ